MADVIISETPEALAERVAADFAALVSEVLASQERFSVALAGGLTPKLFYSRLAKAPYVSTIPWSHLWVFWGDERCVPPDHSESNFGMADQTLLQFVPLAPSHVFRMRGEDPPPQAAQAYEKDLRGFFRNSGLWPVFDLIFLGLGADGHTASLLPGTSAVPEGPDANVSEERRQGEDETMPQPRWVVHNVIRSLQTVRLTLTLPAINQAQRVWFLVTGSKKAPAFAAVRERNPACPASLVQPVHGDIRWYIDKEVSHG
jgi:6-phosphogluconolactonase